MKQLLYFVIFISLTYTLISQTQRIEGNLENIFEFSDENSYSESQIEYIEFRKTNKLNLWNAKLSDITQFPNFNLIQAKNILEFIHNNPGTTITKLSKALNLNGNQVLILDYCTYIFEIVTPNEFIFYSRSKTNYTSDKIYGFVNDKYNGSPSNYSSKTMFEYKNLTGGIVLDKDPGEVNKVDFYSFNAKYADDKLKFIIGDYYYEMGMGNVLWGNFSTGKGIDVINPASEFSNTLKPYRSTVDNSFFRGGAVDYNFQLYNVKFALGGFISNAYRSGTFDSLKQVISSVYTAGYYRTDTEILKKNNLKEKAYSGNFNFEIGNFLFGIGVLSLDYQYPITSISTSSFNGKSGIFKTSYGRYLNEDFSSSYEFSLDAKDFIGFKFGAILSRNNNTYSSHFRYFDQNYRAPYGGIFGEVSNPSNEMGFYLGYAYSGFKDIIINSYIDIFQSLGSTYYIDGIMKGIEIFSNMEYDISKKLQYIVRLKYENKTDEAKVESKNVNYQKQKIYFRNELQYNLTNEIRTRLRIEECYINNAGLANDETGVGSFLEIKYQNRIVTIFGRTSLFSTDSYDSAIWQYEYFIPGNLSSFAAYLDGARYIIGVKGKIFDILSIQILYNRTSKNNVDYLSSGNDKVLANSSDDLILQIEINFN